MARANTKTRYGATAITLHWLSALMILAAFVSGYLAHSAPEANAAEVTRKLTLFSLHKTTGVWIFVIGLARILWAIFQPRPLPLQNHNRIERTLADIAYWLLYSAMVLVPLSGWALHSATTGYAPIWWPFWQDMPFVPKSDFLARLMDELHYLFMVVFGATIALHILGALKHTLIAKDGTLRRILGADSTKVAPHQHQAKPAMTAILIWMLALFGGATLMTTRPLPQAAAPLAEARSGAWTVESGSLQFSITQFEREVLGRFDTWTADIQFDDLTPKNLPNMVKVTIDMGSVSLASLTAQALGPDYFDVQNYPLAVFEAEISQNDEAYLASGTLTLRGITHPVQLPFRLDHDENTAKMTGELRLNRFDFAVGASLTDTSLLGEEVLIAIDLIATRQID